MSEREARSQRRRLTFASALAVAFVAVAGYVGLAAAVLTCTGDETNGVTICERIVVVNALSALSPLLPALAMVACGRVGIRRRSYSLILAAALALGPLAAVGIPLFWLNV